MLIAGVLLITVVVAVIIFGQGLPGSFPKTSGGEGSFGDIIAIDNHTGAMGDAVRRAHDGDTIVLDPGNYHESGITIDRNITLRANTAHGGNAANTVITGTGTGRIFEAKGSLTIDNLMLSNGYATTPSSEGPQAIFGGTGGAINATGALTVISSVIDNCSAENNGGALSGSTVTVISTTIRNCSSATLGGAISGTNVTVDASAIYDCSAAIDGGAVSGQNISVISSVIRDCTTHNSAVYAGAGKVSVESSSISNITLLLSRGPENAISTKTVFLNASSLSNPPGGNTGENDSISATTVTIVASSVTGCLACDAGFGSDENPSLVPAEPAICLKGNTGSSDSSHQTYQVCHDKRI